MKVLENILMFDSFISKVGMKALALATVILLVIAVTFLTVTRVRGFGMMNENETAASQNNSPETTFTQNQLNCLNLDDGWWSPIAGPVVVKACGPAEESSNLKVLSKRTPPSTAESNTETQPATETSTTSTSPDLTETEDKEGNTILSSTFKNVTVTATAATQSIKEDIGIPEVAQQVLDADKKDYVRGLVEGVNGAFQIGERVEKFKGLTPEEVNKKVSDAITGVTEGESDAYKIGLYRGFSMGSDLVDSFGFGVAGHTHKQPNK